MLPSLLNALAALVHELRLAAETVRTWHNRRRSGEAYATRWLALTLDLTDTRGMHAVLTRRQCIEVHGRGEAIVRELVWGEGDQLVRYTAEGARRLAVRPEGSKQAVLLSPLVPPQAGDRLTITSRRTIRNGFRRRDEYLEVLLERSTGRLDLTVLYPAGRPPHQAQLVLSSTETVVRWLAVRYGADGRARLRGRVRRPPIGALYSLRWDW